MQKGIAQLLVLLLVVVLVVAAVIFLRNTRTNKITTFIKQAPAVEEKIKNYQNSDLGITFQYPKELEVKIDSEEDFNKRGNGNYRQNFKGYVSYEPEAVIGAVVVLDNTGSYDLNPFAVWVFNNDKKLTLRKWFDRYWYYPFVWGVFDWTSKGHITLDKEATISGQQAEYKIISYQLGSPKFIYLAKGDRMYLLRVIGKTGEDILETFKFLQ